MIFARRERNEGRKPSGNRRDARAMMGLRWHLGLDHVELVMRALRKTLEIAKRVIRKIMAFIFIQNFIEYL